MARRSKLTPEVQDRIVEAIGMGATYEHAAQYGGISYETFRVWLASKPAFSEAIKAAEGKAVVGWLKKIEHAAAEGTWQAAAWKLERRYPHIYGRTMQEVKHEVSGPDGGPLRHEIKHEFDYDAYADDFTASLAVAEAERIVSGSDGTE